MPGPSSAISTTAKSPRRKARTWIWEPCPRKGDDNYFWLIGEFKDDEPENEKNDHWALANGYVAITPTVVDVTAYGFMNELSKWFE